MGSFNGKPLFEVEDKTFPDGGMIGLWTTADSVTTFGNLMKGRKLVPKRRSCCTT